MELSDSDHDAFLGMDAYHANKKTHHKDGCGAKSNWIALTWLGVTCRRCLKKKAKKEGES